MSTSVATSAGFDAWTPEVRAALCRWLPERRWAGVAGRRVRDVEVLLQAPLEVDDTGGAGGALVVMAARLDDGETLRFQVPLGWHRELPPAIPNEDLIVRSGGLWIFDATAQPALMGGLVTMIGRAHRGPGLTCTAEEPLPWRPSGPPVAIRRLTGEQSNTSLVIDERMILKLFRRPDLGLNPELEVQRRLRGDQGMPVPALLGAVEAWLPEGQVTLAVLTRYVPGAVDGWNLLLEDLAGPAPGGPSVRDAVRDLGATVARMHERLAVAFGSARLTPQVREGLHADLIRRLGEAGGTAGQLQLYLPGLRAVIDRARTGPGAGHVQRVHGDLHLGQVLRSGGRWLVIDFEGEPAAAVTSRSAWRSPWQDVAGMLRSIDYAAGLAVLDEVVPRAAARSWAAVLREAFRAGYVAHTGVDVDPLLPAYEVDKAVYEVVYELRNRPGWLDIPLSAVHRLAGSGPA
ncbi:phosphotransferase [Micromonospora sp. NBS 11-29]|uniref:phosphotransferase n=1 Tax=Micromonospora sp. NBS 11-29 TaxID=1960879 RepID=UPI000B784BDB|nr:phosphotransferase [Micromonospora sp. NBS 11-29]